MFKKDLPISAKKILELDVRIINTLIMSEFDQDFHFFIRSIVSRGRFPDKKWAK